MSTVIHIERLPSSTGNLIALSAAAIVVGCVAAAVGLPAIYCLIALSILVIFAAVALRQPTLTLSAAIWCLGLFPFSWGLKSGVFPKLFGDEVLLVLYLAVFPFFYFFRRRVWRPGFGSFYLVLAVFLFAQCVSFIPMEHDLIALRNFIETCVLGPLLAVLVLQEASNADAETIGTAIVWLSAVIAALSILERIVLRNPIMEHQLDITYISPQLAQITNGVYRPYVSFFHPSEAGTFMGLGFPFVLRKVARERSAIYATVLLLVAAGLFINATRGVWVGVAAACVLIMPNALLFMAVAVPAAAVSAIIGYMALKDTPFLLRIMDVDHLLSRFVSWQLALNIFSDHPFIGVGHMQFKQVYLHYVQDLSSVANFDIAKVYVVDNLYLTVLAEHGAIGLLGVLGLFIFVFVALGRSRKRLLAAGLSHNASFVRAAQSALAVFAVTGCFADLNLFTKATKFLFILVGLGFAMSTPPGAAHEFEPPVR